VKKQFTREESHKITTTRRKVGGGAATKHMFPPPIQSWGHVPAPCSLNDRPPPMERSSG